MVDEEEILIVSMNSLMKWLLILRHKTIAPNIAHTDSFQKKKAYFFFFNSIVIFKVYIRNIQYCTVTINNYNYSNKYYEYFTYLYISNRFRLYSHNLVPLSLDCVSCSLCFIYYIHTHTYYDMDINIFVKGELDIVIILNESKQY